MRERVGRGVKKQDVVQPPVSGIVTGWQHKVSPNLVGITLLQQFRRLDAYAKPLDDIRIRTANGAYGTMEALHGQQTFSL